MHARTLTNLNSRHFKCMIGIFGPALFTSQVNAVKYFQHIRIKRVCSTNRDTWDREAEAVSLTPSLNKSNFMSTNDKFTLPSCSVYKTALHHLLHSYQRTHPHAHTQMHTITNTQQEKKNSVIEISTYRHKLAAFCPDEPVNKSTYRSWLRMNYDFWKQYYQG